MSEMGTFAKTERRLIETVRNIQDWEGTLNKPDLQIRLDDLFISMQKRRFQKSEARPTEKWQKLSQGTEDRSKGRRRVGDRPLVDTGRMARSVQHEIQGAKSVIGSSLKDIPRAQHFGRRRMVGRVKAYRRLLEGRAINVKAHTTHLPKIPARPIKFDADTVRIALRLIVRAAIPEPT